MVLIMTRRCSKNDTTKFQTRIDSCVVSATTAVELTSSVDFPSKTVGNLDPKRFKKVEALKKSN